MFVMVVIVKGKKPKEIVKVQHFLFAKHKPTITVAIRWNKQNKIN